LNDPTLSGQNASSSALLAHKLDSVTKQALAAIPKTQIKQVKAKDFEPYLNRIKDSYDRYVEVLNQMVDGEEFSLSIPLDNFLDMKQMAGNFGPKFTMPTKVAADPVESIPTIFFEPDFNLENPRIFDMVTEFANVTSATPAIMTYQSAAGVLLGPTSPVSNKSHEAGGGGIQTTNTILQEKLSHYLDTVEMHLVAEISKRSVEFFSALSNIQSLHKETVRCLADIRVIRSSLAQVAEEQAKNGLILVRKRNRRNNLTKIFDIITMVKEVKNTQPMIQVLLSQGDYVGSLDLIAQTNRLLKGRPTPSSVTAGADAAEAERKRHHHHQRPLVQLNAVRGLVHLSGQLAEMAKMIGNLMENDFVELLMADLNQLAGADTAGSGSVGGQIGDYARWAQSILFDESIDASSFKPFTTEDLCKDDELRSRMVPLVYGLVRTEKLSSAVQLHRDNSVKIVKAVTKQFFPPALPSEEKPTGVAAAAVVASGGDPSEKYVFVCSRIIFIDRFCF
jgi:vacuolar protein sorting-associated protein 54